MTHEPGRLLALRLTLVRGVSLCALAALALSSPSGRIAALVGGVAISAGWALQRRPPQRALWSAVTVLVAAGTLITPLLGLVPWRWAGMGLVLFLMAHRARVGRAPSDDRLALLFALLTLLLAAADARSLILAPLLLFIVLAMPAALVLIQLAEMEAAGAVQRQPLGGERRWAALIGMGAAGLVLTAGLFLTLPRLNAGALASLGDAVGSTGFDAEDVTLGELGISKVDQSLVLRAEVTDATGTAQRGPFYFRGSALDDFDGARWTVSEGLRELRRRRVRGGVDSGVAYPGQLRQELLIEPMEGAPLFGIPHVEGIVVDGDVRRDLLGSLWIGGPATARRVVLFSAIDGGGAGPVGVASRVMPGGAFTALPEDLDLRIHALVQRLTEGADTRQDKAARLEAALRDGYTYTLIPPPEVAHQDLSGFLFESKTGHCEYFATALAVMLRAAGVPAVLTVGFYGGQWNALGGYIAVRQSHAHAWVEAELEPGRWARLDATPAGDFAGDAGGLGAQLGDVLRARWQTWVIDYDLDQQLYAAQALGAALFPSGEGPARVAAGPLLLIPLAGLALAAVRARRWAAGERRVRLGPVARAHGQARALVASRGWHIPQALPPVEAAAWLVAEVGEVAAPLQELAWLHYCVRYGAAPEPQALPRAKACLKALRALPRRRSSA